MSRCIVSFQSVNMANVVLVKAYLDDERNNASSSEVRCFAISKNEFLNFETLRDKLINVYGQILAKDEFAVYWKGNNNNIQRD